MTFLRGLLAARAHLAFLVGLAAAFLTVRAVDRSTAPRLARERAGAAEAVQAEALPVRARAQTLDARELAMARAAWAYVRRNTRPETGLATSVQGWPTATLWDLGSQLMAILAAEDLGLASRREASTRLGRAIDSLARLPLCDGRLPSKVYDVRTLAMVRFDGAPAPDGLGWSVLDLARLLTPLSLVAWRHPELAARARAAVARWRLDALAEGGELRGATRGRDGTLASYQEGRLGYEQLAAKELLGWGLPVAPLLDWSHATWTEVDGEAVPQDDRRPADHGGTRAPLLSEPWVLDALENGFDAATLPVARALLSAQARRFEETGRLTAASEDHLDRPPWFSYSAVVDGDDRWAARAPDGAPAPFTFSTKAAVAWGVLFAGPYPDALLAAAAALVVPGEGLLAGRYDVDGAPNRVLSLNTNAVVLEALAYRVRGPARAAALAPEAAPAREARR